MNKGSAELILVGWADKPRREDLLKRICSDPLYNNRNFIFMGVSTREEFYVVLQDFVGSLSGVVIEECFYPSLQRQYEQLDGRPIVLLAEDPDALEQARMDGYSRGILIGDSSEIDLAELMEPFIR